MNVAICNHNVTDWAFKVYYTLFYNKIIKSEGGDPK